MVKKCFSVLLVLGMMAGGCSTIEKITTSTSSDKELYIITPEDGEAVTNPMTVRFGIKGMGIAPAGVEQPNSGHHHLMIDVDKLPPMDQPIPRNENFLHFGDGQTETSLELNPGKHTLQLLLGDHIHMPHEQPLVSKKITITVSDPLFPGRGGAYFISPRDNEVVSSPVRVLFGLKGMGVGPASVDWPNTGHHHLLVDVDKLPPMDQPLPKNENYLHFGGGETEATIELSPGKHTLQMLLGDHLHIPHKPPVLSRKITITVR